MFAGGVTAVHTTFVPAPSVSLVGLGLGEVGRRGRDMNINPNLNGGAARREEPHGRDVHGKEGVDGFEGFAESNMFTMKNLDAYRMHLWGKMAAQYHQHQQSSGNQYLSQQQQQQSQQQQQQQQQAYQQQQQQLTGLASRLGRSWFQTSSLSDASNNNSSSNSNNNSLPRTPFSNFSNFSTAGGNGGGPTYHYSPLLSAILSGKGGVGGGSGSGYSYSSASFKRHPPSSASSVSGGSGDSQGQGQKLGQQEQQQKQQQAQKQAQEQVQKQAQAAMLAAVASQTILRKMGQAFWDAFAGHGGGEVVGASGSGSGRGMLIKHFDAPSAGSSSSSASSSSSPSSSSYLASSPPASSTSPSTYSASSTSSPSSYSPNPSSYSPRPAFKPWDADKVKKVLEGKAVVRVVDVDQLYRLGEGGSVTGSAKVHGSGSTSTSTTTTGTNVSQGGSLSVPSSPVIKAAAPVVQCNLTAACSALEEKMKSLRL
ncbi:hypothetical protein FA15DRAFT_672258 [Coprinopsis marcescibilis]|uniref:Uncharacterized protein n=1 Tax=Coprinopsis marcescibilis TaxID=230819 RepID=A0A5C3KMP8_COPMA|nr:hypothetical protein FA15DRAFT_672258 [Coprinopsis marcescibilis]